MESSAGNGTGKSDETGWYPASSTFPYLNDIGKISIMLVFASSFLIILTFLKYVWLSEIDVLFTIILSIGLAIGILILILHTLLFMNTRRIAEDMLYRKSELTADTVEGHVRTVLNESGLEFSERTKVEVFPDTWRFNDFRRVRNIFSVDDRHFSIVLMDRYNAKNMKEVTTILLGPVENLDEPTLGKIMRKLGLVT